MAASLAEIPPKNEWDVDFFPHVEKEIQLDREFDNTIIVDGLPIVGPDRYNKLVKVINKKFSEFGPIEKDGIYLPMLEEEGSSKGGKTIGLAFIQYTNADDAKRSLVFDHFDKKTPVKVNVFGDFQKFKTYPEEYKEPSLADVELKADPNTYLRDEYGRDQYVIRQSSETEVFWNDPIRKDTQGRSPYVDRDSPDTPVDKRRTRMILANTALTDGAAVWSPRGTYLAAIENQKDVVLYCGEELKECRRFSHPGVIRFDISPMERFLVTFVPQEIVDEHRKKEPRCIIVWDIEKGKLARGFEGDWALKEGVGQWPIMKWSYDDKYFARMGRDKISVYESSSMGLLNKKSLSIKKVDNFEWSPSGYLLSFTVPEGDNMPAKIQVMSIPSGEVVGKRSFQLVSSLRMGWHDQGRYLAVKVTYYAKRTRKDRMTSFEIFSVQRKNCPVDRVELGKDESGSEITDVTAFAFEPTGNRFCIIHGSYPGGRADISIFETGKQIKRVAFIKKQIASHLFWSPKGTHLVIAGLADRNGVLCFYDCNRFLAVKQEEHYMCSDVAWSPCGRYVCTSVTQPLGRFAEPRNTMENGYKVWSLHGELLVDNAYKSLYLFAWRPRPPDVLPASKKKAIQRNLGKYSTKFDELDEKTVEGTLGADARKRRTQLKAFREYISSVVKLVQSEEAEIRERFPYLDQEDEYEIEEIEIEEEISHEVEIVE